MSTRYDILSEEQHALLPRLRPTRELGFVLYGGTAIALQLGHRRSVDFDFFTSRPLDETLLIERLPFLATATTLQRDPRTLTVLASGDGADGPVMLSFFGGLTMGRIEDPSPTSGGEILLASLLDLLGHKLKVLMQRVEAKDYLDIAALLRSGLSIERGLAAAAALFGPGFPVSDALRTLSWFGEGDLSALPADERDFLTDIAQRAGPIPPLAVRSRELDL